MAHGRYADREQAPQGVGPGVILTAGVVMLIAGALVVLRALTSGAALPPASAQQIPKTVGTAVPFAPNASSVAPPLARSTPMTIEIPAIGVSAPVMRLGRASDGTLQVPPLDDHNLAGWYDRSVTPGQQGSSIILGHVDNYTGPSVFFSIKTLRSGDKIDIVRADGRTAVFAVDGVQKVAKALFPANSIYGNVPYPGLRLITCGGPFDAARGQYLDSIVVYAHLTRAGSR
jgi:sortase (surface protein transpeptidase)